MELADLLRDLQKHTHYHGKKATVPAYLLELIFIEAGLQTEREYTEEG